jgi:SAM-dependent methyltransferase
MRLTMKHVNEPDRTAQTIADRIYAGTYDATSVGWPGEQDGYLRWCRAAAQGARPPRVLEVACGTGRVARALADAGCEVVGVDASAAMIDQAESQRPGGNPRWEVGDMRTFQVGEQFDIALIPGHSFQFMTTAGDQVAALDTIGRSLRPDGCVVIHIDRPSSEWVAGLPTSPPDPTARNLGGPLTDPATGVAWRSRYAWTYDPATEIATFHADWVNLDEKGDVVQTVPQNARHLKIIGRVEMEHALLRAGFRLEDVFGDFVGGPVSSAPSGEMVWVARRSLD